MITQDVQLFPKTLLSPIHKMLKRRRRLPDGIESITVQTDDGKSLEVWRLEADPFEKKVEKIALIFHGNAGTLDHFLALQLWLSSLGITSYCFDYRGFGNSTGWPSEKGFERDSDCVWSYLIARERVGPEDILVVGYSVGGAPAARIASLHNPKLLVLISAFSSLRQAARDQFILGPLYRLLSPFLWWKLPTANYVSKISKASLIVAHGEKDRIVPISHMKELLAVYSGTGKTFEIKSPSSGHNDLFFTVRQQLEDIIRKDFV